MPLILRPIRSRAKRKDFAAMLKVVERAIDDEFKPFIVDDLDGIVADWNHKPTFQPKKSVRADAITLTVTVKRDKAGQIFNWVDQGTKPYIIRPRNKKALAFTGRSPKTRAPGGRRRGVAPGQSVVARVVHHPGIQPRKFIYRRRVKYQKEFRRIVDAAFRRAAKA